AGDIPAPDLAAAERKLDALARTVEAGDLNRAASLRDEAKQAFLDVLRAKLPPLLDKTDAALVQARRAGAKRYAPTLYEAARQWLAGALAWVSGASRIVPEHPRRGLALAEAARDMAEQVKQWRKHPDSFERLVLRARKERLMLARALNLPVDESDPLADVPVKTLTQAITRLERQLREERQARQRERDTLKAEYERRLQAETEAARQEALAAAAAQMKQLKEAFRAKLERETFETRRLKSLRKLFRKGEVNIMANLDGSVLIRLSALKFAPGKSTLDRKYFDLLRRVKQGLELYPDRKIIIEGHTDNQGDARANQRLSLKRAEGVRDFLVAAGMPAGRLKALGYGEVRPIASNDYERGRAMNRRIDIIIQPPA
ncbi:MAG: OmpA family protein, partial [Planctomycetota bacterium]